MVLCFMQKTNPPGALSAGASEVFVKDAHDSARNINHAALPVQNVPRCQVPMPEYFMMEAEFVKHSMAYARSFCHFVLSDG